MSQPTTTTFDKAMHRLADYEDAIQRLGEFGRLFVDYRGCPRGPMGRMAGTLEAEVLSMPVIKDVDGGRWVPVNADALHELVNEYRELRARYKEKVNEPLTKEQLREMNGEPVWVQVLDHDMFADEADDFDGWGIVRKSWVRIWDERRGDLVHIDYHFEEYGQAWLAYRHKPKEATNHA